MTTSIDKEAIRQAYDLVREDKSDTNWAVFKYEGNKIVVQGTGVEFVEFVTSFSDDERLFAFIRVFTGDELSKRAKFAFIAWIGSAVGPLKRAKCSIDKSLVKEIVSNFAVEIAASDKSDLDQETIRQLVVKAGGANYGNGVPKN